MASAVVYTETGPADVLHVTEVDAPSPGPGQVRLAARAAAVNPIDWKIRSGSFGQVDLPKVPGADVAGIVDLLGEGVDTVAEGDEVFGFASGGAYATSVLADAGMLVHRPTAMSWEVAAALPISAEAAQRVLDHLAVADGDMLLIHGAAGSVGAMAVQFAVARGARVVGTASERHHDYLRGIGATPTVYGDGLVDRVRELAPQGVDAVLDTAGQGALPASIELRGGTTDRIVTIADPDADAYGVTFSGGGGQRSLAGLHEAARLCSAGVLDMPVRATYPLHEAAAAHRDSEDGHGRGKIILLPPA